MATAGVAAMAATAGVVAAAASHASYAHDVAPAVTPEATPEAGTGAAPAVTTAVAPATAADGYAGETATTAPLEQAAPAAPVARSLEPVAAPLVTQAASAPAHTVPAETHTPYPPKSADPIVMRKSVEELHAERHTMLDSAGLALVETDAGKWRAAYDRSARYVEPPRAPRVKRPAVVIDHGPLVLVETRK